MMMILMILMTMNMNIKSTGIKCINLILYSLTTSILMSNIIKLTLIPFIITLTILGGLLILFLYFTSSNLPNPDEMKKNKWFPIMILSLYSTLVTLSYNNFLDMQLYKPLNHMNIKNPDPTELILFSNSNTLTTMLMMLLIIMLVSMIKLCSKVNSPIRRKWKN